MADFGNIPIQLEQLSSDEFILNMGPQHPATHGVLRVVLKMDGEVVKDIVPDIGYVHRGLEKLFENRKYPQIMPYLDRTDYLSAVNNEWAYAKGVEKLMGVEVPERAEYIRVILAEIGRINSHLLWYSAFGIDVGALTPIFYAFREREILTALMVDMTGARLTHHALRIGGFYYDLPKDFVPKLSKFLDTFESKVDDYENLLIENIILSSRMKNVGNLTKEKAIEYGVSGPPLRASNCDIDLRKQDSYGVYGKFDFEVATGPNGDSYDRCKVRMKEMRESAKILRQAIDNLPEGDVMAKVPKIIKPAPGEIYSRVEGPRGEVGVYIVSDGTDKPYKLKLREPSFSNLSIIKELVVGTKIADLVVIMATLDFVIPSIDR